MGFLNNTLSFLIGFFFQLSLLLLLYLVVRLILRQELGWKLFYGMLSFVIVFLIAALGAPSLLSYLLQNCSSIEERFIIRDGNSFVALLMDLSLFVSFLVVFPLLVFYLFTYISGTLTTFENKVLRQFLFLFYYYYLVSLIIVDQDLSLSAWDTVLATEVLPLGVQLQPDLDFLFMSYRGEWVDFSLFLLCEVALFFGFYQGYFVSFWRQESVHFGLLFLHSLSIFYFFCGEGWLYDFLLLIFSSIAFEIIYLQLRVLYYLKMKKSTTS